MKYSKTNRKMHTYYIKDTLFVSNWKTSFAKIAIYLSITLFVFAIFVLPHMLLKRNYQPQKDRFSTDIKYVLIWTSKRNKRHFHYTKTTIYSTGQREFIKQNCEYINCYITYNDTLLHNDNRNFDAVVFDIHEIKNFKNKLDFNLSRSEHQKYIFKSLESSEKYPVCHPMFDDFFNWTWTYKLNSDISHPFVNIYNLKGEMTGPIKNMSWNRKMEHANKFNNVIKDKSKAVAWIQHTCKEKNTNHELIKELENELKVFNYEFDIFGPCGKHKCPDGPISKCYKMIEKKYFFHLVVEKHFAEDYVTEDITRTLGRILVPIVLGGANYSSFLVPGTYINIRTFDIKKAGAIIHYLMKNHKMYEYFFDWKNYYKYKAKPKSYICDLCTKLNNNNLSTQNKYENFRQWWNPDFEYKDYCHKRNYNIYNNEEGSD